MKDAPTLVLSHEQIMQKIKRIAYQLYEINAAEKAIYFVAIADRGVKLAELIKPVLQDISGISVTALTLTVNKKNPMQRPTLHADGEQLRGRTVVLIDDVLNSGRTLVHAAAHVLQFGPAALRTVVLVDRLHRLFPIKADFVGLTLSTTLQDHIQVSFDQGSLSAHLV